MGVVAPRTTLMIAYSCFPSDPRVHREARSLVAAGIAVSVVCLRQEGESSLEELHGVRVVRVPMAPVRGGRLRYAYQYCMFLLLVLARLRGLRNRPSVVHVHSLPDFLVLVGLGYRLRGSRLILDLHESMPEIIAARFGLSPRSLMVRFAIALEKLSTLVADDVIAVSEPIRRLLIRRGIPGRKITVIMNSPSGRLSPSAAGPPDRLVYAGGLNRERDLVTYLGALARLRGTLDLSLTIYGSGDSQYLDELRGTVKALNLEDRVWFAGVIPPDRVLAELCRSKVGVVSYERNPLTELALPNKIFEFALVRRPLVVANLPAMRELFESAALFYEPSKPEDLATKLQKAIAGGPHVEAMVERASRIASAFSWEKMEARLVRLYVGDPSPQSSPGQNARLGEVV